MECAEERRLGKRCAFSCSLFLSLTDLSFRITCFFGSIVGAHRSVALHPVSAVLPSCHRYRRHHLRPPLPLPSSIIISRKPQSASCRLLSCSSCLSQWTRLDSTTFACCAVIWFRKSSQVCPMIVNCMGYACFVVPVSKIYFSCVHFLHVHDKPCFVLYNTVLILVDGRLMFFFCFHLYIVL